jgi:hypothetical protein
MNETAGSLAPIPFMVTPEQLFPGSIHHASEQPNGMAFVVVVHFKDGTSGDTDQSEGSTPPLGGVTKVQVAGRSVLCKVIGVKPIQLPSIPRYDLVETEEI